MNQKPVWNRFCCRASMQNTPGIRQSAKKRAVPRENFGASKRRLSTETEEVEVVCRLAPYNGISPCLIPLTDKTVKCIPPQEARKRDGSFPSEKAYDFGYIFDTSDSQQNVFNRCAIDLIKNFVSGKDSLLFTYGVTGSGKTYTMAGKNTHEGAGILPRTLDVIFNSIDNQTQSCVFYPKERNTYGIKAKLEAHLERKTRANEKLQKSTEINERVMEKLVVPGYNDFYACAVFVSYVEIYNNYCYDLLDEEEITRKDIRVDARNYAFVEGAKEFEVENSNEALELFCRGEERRQTSETLLNKKSSRSHSIFTIRLVMAPAESYHPNAYPCTDSDQIVVSQLCLVDLAGSERTKRTQNTGSRLVEAGNINKSLLVLRRCFDILRKNQRNQGLAESIPYRESKLTQLFKNYFEGGGQIRMIICANPKPDDYEENLNVLSFAEESQLVKISKQAERLFDDENRPPVPRRFYARWNQDIDQIQSSIEEGVNSYNVPPLNLAGYNDHIFALRWKNYFSAQKDNETANERNLTQNALRLEPALRNALCYGDYMATQCGEMKEQQAKDVRTIAELTSQTKQLQREVQSMAGRLRRNEENDEELMVKEEQMRKDRLEVKSKLRSTEKAIQAIHEIVTVSSPSVAQLSRRFMSGAKSEDRAPHPATPSSQIRKPRIIEKTNTPSGPGYFNPKYQRRSKSASRILDHQPLVRVPTGGILRNAYPSNTKHVLTPTTEDLRKSSDYVLTHQEVDREGNISTSIVKGNCIPTAGGGTAVMFNDVERLTHENLKETPKRP